MAHLAVDSWLPKRCRRRVDSACRKRQLTRVTGRARRLIDRIAGRAMELRNVRSCRARRVDQLPVIDPRRAQPVVLNWEYQQPRIRELRRIRLLPFRSDDVVNRVANPFIVIAASNLNEVACAVCYGARMACDDLRAREVADDICRAIRPEHLGHAGGLPIRIHAHVALATDLRSGISTWLTRWIRRRSRFGRIPFESRPPHVEADR